MPSFDDYEYVFPEQPVVPSILLIPSAINSQMVIDSPYMMIMKMISMNILLKTLY
jgi:hypothetical protein